MYRTQAACTGMSFAGLTQGGHAIGIMAASIEYDDKVTAFGGRLRNGKLGNYTSSARGGHYLKSLSI